VQGHWNYLTKYSEWTKEALLAEKSVRLLVLRVADSQVSHNQRFDNLFKILISVIEASESKRAQMNGGPGAFGLLDADASASK